MKVGGGVLGGLAQVGSVAIGRGPVGSTISRVYRGGLSATLDQLEDMGLDAMLSLVGGSGSPLGIALKAFFDYNQLNAKRFGDEVEERWREEDKKDKPVSAAQRRRQKLAHLEWLRDNRWRFDWRSQPRRPAGSDAGGEWMEGRLEYQAETKKAFSRAVLRRRTRSMRQYKQRMKAMGNNTTRTIRSKWGDF